MTKPEMTASNTAHVQAACLAVRDLAANGATFNYRPAADGLPPSFTYELNGEGDQKRCRAIIAAAKADPLTWAAVLAEIADRSARAR